MIEFTNRQLDIVEILKKHEPITAEQIADMLGVSKATLRSDLAVLVMTGYLDAKPKVGYFLGKTIKDNGSISNRIKEIKVKDVQGVPVVVQGTSTVHDAVITLFLENVGSMTVVDEAGYLEGIVSRKDLLKVTLGNATAATIPVNLVMTRQPNIVTISQEESVIEAARKMIHSQVDSLPVVITKTDENQETKQLVVGRITKTNMTRLLLESVTES
ncbi:helix-turn-helix transcriptional regulator [Aquibacillus saliphilus]|uniref:helix-turn-helix transcriptional regulator n=1 Tax=Aquibacillus saliphilus TaxID=1909422 RepID=UPI001CF0A7FA|nr:helix-turn-helix transcriptional regulator [Aquibacillus saliphilus]